MPADPLSLTRRGVIATTVAASAMGPNSSLPNSVPPSDHFGGLNDHRRRGRAGPASMLSEMRPFMRSRPIAPPWAGVASKAAIEMRHMPCSVQYRYHRPPRACAHGAERRQETMREA